MRVIILVLLLPSLLCAQQNIDVRHYRFQVELNDNNDTIAGKATVQLAFTEKTDLFELDLVQSDGAKKGMEILHIDGRSLKRHETLASASKIRFHLDKTAQKGDTASFTIIYKGVPADGLIISKIERFDLFAKRCDNVCFLRCHIRLLSTSRS